MTYLLLETRIWRCQRWILFCIINEKKKKKRCIWLKELRTIVDNVLLVYFWHESSFRKPRLNLLRNTMLFFSMKIQKHDLVASSFLWFSSYACFVISHFLFIYIFIFFLSCIDNCMNDVNDSLKKINLEILHHTWKNSCGICSVTPISLWSSTS